VREECELLNYSGSRFTKRYFPARILLRFLPVSGDWFAPRVLFITGDALITISNKLHTVCRRGNPRLSWFLLNGGKK
jgi:transcriptional antiterminator